MRMMQLFSLVLAIIFFSPYAWAVDSSAVGSSSSTSVIPPKVQAEVYTCSGSTYDPNSVYRSSEWRCSQSKDEKSCNPGDVVVGGYSHYVKADFFCRWYCAKVIPKCAWQPVKP